MNNSPNAAYLRFKLKSNAGVVSANGIRLLNGTILTDDPTSGRLDRSKHIVIDMDNVTTTPGQNISVVIFKTASEVNLTGIVAPINVATGWKNFNIELQSVSVSEYTYIFKATYEPCINPTNGGTISASQTICNNTAPAAFASTALPTGHTGTLQYQLQISTDSINFVDLATGTYSSTSYQAEALTQTTWFRRLARVDCKTDWTGAAESNLVKVSVELTPISGTLAKTPDQTNVCEGTNVSAALTAGSGGNGLDSLVYRTNDGTNWSAWTAYTSSNNIATTGKTSVEILTLRKADYCSNATATSVSWSIGVTAVSGTLAKTPNTTNVCEGTNVSAALTAGS